MREEYQRVFATVDLDAICSNMEKMKANVAEHTKLIGVIKTDGYGHGAVPIARELEKLPFVWGYATATAEEAFILRHDEMKKPILILGYTFPYSYERLISEEIRMAVFRKDMLLQLSEKARRLGKKAKIHIKVDTGMGRIGVRPDQEGLDFVKEAFQTPGIEVEGIFTHFARADEADKTAANKQLNKFQTFLAMIKDEGLTIPVKHCSNSAGIVELPEANMDVARAGITLYGLWPSNEVRRDIVELRPALSLYSHLVYIKEIEPGDSVSYGGTFTAQKKTRVGTVPVGYGDGYPRGLSGKGYVLVNGKKAAILGRVCMDQFMIDLSEIPEAKEGDKVTLIGKDGAYAITMEELGNLSGRFNYELACDLSKRVPRIYMKDGKILCTKDYYQDY